jgi:hypothetical protein
MYILIEIKLNITKLTILTRCFLRDKLLREVFDAIVGASQFAARGTTHPARGAIVLLFGSFGSAICAGAG